MKTMLRQVGSNPIMAGQRVGVTSTGKLKPAKNLEPAIGLAKTDLVPYQSALVPRTGEVKTAFIEPSNERCPWIHR